MAQALQNDPDLIYQYVHDNIEYSPLWGSLKGAVGTLLDGRGNSFDQASLMVALLNQASLSNHAISNVNFVIGQLNVSSAQLQSWMGVDNNPNTIGGILGSGGIPGNPFTDGSADVGQVWVQVSIIGTAYVFDPAFKSHTYKTGIVSDLPGIMGYTQAQFVSDGGATVTATSIEGVNRTKLRSDLTTYATNLASYIRTNMPLAGVSDVVGGGTIVPTPFANGVTVRQTSNPNQDPTVTPTVTATIPSEYFATLSVTLPGAATQTFNSFDIYGHRLSIFFDSTFTPTLYLDGVAQVTGSANNEGDQVPIQESVTIPWATFANQSLTQYVTAESSANNAGYVVSTGWDQVGRDMIEKHRSILRQAINSGNAANSELVLGETVAMIGYAWLAQNAAQQHLADQLLGTVTQYFYGGGITGEATGPNIASPYVDLPLNFINTPARVNSGNAQSPNSMAAFLDSSGNSSSFESATLEQTQSGVPGFTAASTVKLLDIGIQNNDTIFDINNGNTAASQAAYNNTIRPQMVPNYNPNDLQTIDGYVKGGFRVIAPLHGQIPIGSWTGVGFKTMEGSQDSGFSYGEIISGGLSAQVRRQAGGYGGANDPPLLLVQTTNGSMLVSAASVTTGPYTGPGSTGQPVGDPIDHKKGSFFDSHQDLSIGARAFPYGLSFQRSYDSGAQQITGPLGFGWNHNFAITATTGSDGFSGMGLSTPLAAAGSMVALYVSSDLVNGQALSGQANLAQFVLETVVNHWFTDQLTNNAVYVNQGWNNEQFTAVPDGTYAPQQGTAAILDSPSGAFRYRTKAGVTFHFNSAGQISTWSNAAGASVTFTYSGGLLINVSNPATGRQLTITYNGNLVSSVTDGKRTVSYSYTKGNLTTFTDALSQNTTYAYDTSGVEDTTGHLTQIFYPSHPANAFVTNFYDPLGRIEHQLDANGNQTLAFFAGSRSELDDAFGNRYVWNIDALNDVTAEIQDYGPAPHTNITTVNTYDAQRNRLTMTMPEGNSTAYTYDALFNPLTVTQSPKPGSTLAPLKQTFTYTAPVATLPNFEEIGTSTDPEGNVTTNSYSASTGTLSSKALPAVPKPGAAMSSPTWTYTYTPIGLPQSATDPEGRVVHFAYDPTFGGQITTATADYGRLNLASSFTYDTAGNIATVTDADGHVSTNTYDNLRRLLEMDRAIAGVVTKYTYFPDGQIQTMARQLTAGTFETTTYSYTLEDQLSTVTDPLGNTVTTTYDADHRQQTVTTQVSATQNRQRTYTYDALDRPYQVSDTTGGSPGTLLETHAYSPNSKEVAFTDANGHQIGYVYDGYDRLAQTTYPDGTSEQYTYNPDGAPLQKTARSGQTIVYTYDALNRMATKTPTGETAGAVNYGYDYSGRLLQAADATSTTPYSIGYDTAGRAIGYSDQQGRNTQVQLDGVGNRTRLQWPAGTNGAGSYFVTYAYDALNRMTEIDANGSISAPLAKYQWDALSRPTLITHGDGTTDSYSQYDAADNPLTLAQSFTGGAGVTSSYSWFKNHQRQSTTVSNSTFQYNPASGTTGYTPANVDNGYAAVNSVNLTYDGDHNLTYDGFNTLAYDVENRLIQAQNAISGTSQYLYDPLGRRKQKVVAGVSTQFVLAGDEEVADYSGTGAGTPQILTVRGVGGSPVASVTVSSGAVAFYHHEVLGSTVALTQAGTSGAAEAFTYSEFGAPSGGSGAAYLFAGYRYDAETGLYYVRARYYSPQLGRFLQPDPIGISGGRNLYAYVNNDPVNLTDPNGTTVCPFVIAGIGGVAFVVLVAAEVAAAPVVVAGAAVVLVVAAVAEVVDVGIETGAFGWIYNNIIDPLIVQPIAWVGGGVVSVVGSIVSGVWNAGMAVLRFLMGY
jgi:RHS repeat-associated protein